MSFVPFQRLMTLLMAAGLLVFLVVLALQRHDYHLIAIALAVFVLYLAFNVWVIMRMRKSGRL